MTVLHLGPLHAVEWVMFLALLLGPVAALATTVLVVRRRDEREAALEHGPGRANVPVGARQPIGSPTSDIRTSDLTHVPAPRTPSERS